MATIKNALVLAVTAAMSLTLLTGCSSSTSQTSSQDEYGSTKYESSQDSSSDSTNNSTSSAQTTSSAPVSFADSTLTNLGTFDESTVTGAGDSVVDIPCSGTPCAIELHHDGGSNFAVWCVDSSGNNLDLMVNTIGQYSGIVTDFSDSDDAAMLSINADGNWSATFRPLKNIQQMTNGAQMQGDNVVYLDEQSLTKLNITNQGSSNFTVKAIGMNKSDLLVNEIGAYNGTVIWNEPQSILIVHSDGQWSMSW